MTFGIYLVHDLTVDSSESTVDSLDSKANIRTIFPSIFYRRSSLISYLALQCWRINIGLQAILYTWLEEDPETVCKYWLDHKAVGLCYPLDFILVSLVLGFKSKV